MDAKRQDRVALCLIIAIGAAARIHFIDEPMRSDEAYTYNEYATRSLYDAVSLYTFPNNHLLHTLLVHVVVRWFDGAPWAVRLPALLAGLALIPATYAMVRRIADPRSALFAAAFVAASDPLISYSVNGRGYTLLCLITTLFVWSASRIREDDGGRVRDWRLFTLLPPLGFFTIPIMLFPFGGVLVWLVIGRLTRSSKVPRLDRLLVAAFVSAGLTVLLYAPTLLRVGWKSVVANQFVAPRAFEEVRQQLPGSLVEVRLQWNLDIPLVVVDALVAAWFIALILPWPGRRGARALTGVTLTVFVWSLGVVLYQSRVPFDRVWLFLLPLYLGCLGTALGMIATLIAKEWATRVAAVLLALALVALVVRSDSIPKESRRLTINHGAEIARRLAPLLSANAAVITELPCDGPLKYYFLVNEIPVEPLYDYRIARARRLYIVVNRPNGQTVESVMKANKMHISAGHRAELVEDYEFAAIYVLE